MVGRRNVQFVRPGT